MLNKNVMLTRINGHMIRSTANGVRITSARNVAIFRVGIVKIFHRGAIARRSILRAGFCLIFRNCSSSFLWISFKFVGWNF